MVKPASRVRLLIGLVLSSLLVPLVGCFEEKDTLTIFPNGAGTIHLHRKYGEEMSKMLTTSAQAGKEKQEIYDSFYSDLSHWQGITAWAPASANLENGRVINDAIGYFEDIRAVKRVEGDVEAEDTTSFSWGAIPQGGFKFRWTSKEAQTPDPLGSDVPQKLIDMFKGLRVERAVILPGTIRTCSGCTEQSGRLASFVVTGDDVAKLLTLQKDYRTRIANHQITKGRATAEFRERTKAAEGNLEITFSPDSLSGEFEQFEKDYQKAKGEFAASGTTDKIHAASKPD
jgi:hypothetical protein